MAQIAWSDSFSVEVHWSDDLALTQPISMEKAEPAMKGSQQLNF